MGNKLQIRRPSAVRPWQHVLEPLYGYLILAEKLWTQPELSGAFNFGPYAHQAVAVKEIIEHAQQVYGGDIQLSDENEGFHEATWLSLETSKARAELGIYPKWTMVESVTRAMAWYRAQSSGADARALCLADITDYES